MAAMKTLFDHMIVPINATYKNVIILSYYIILHHGENETYVSSSYSLSSVMLSYILAHTHRRCPQPVEHSNPALQQEQRRVSYPILHLIKSHYFQQRIRSNIHVTLHGHQFTLYCFPAKILWMQMWTKP